VRTWILLCTTAALLCALFTTTVFSDTEPTDKDKNDDVRIMRAVRINPHAPSIDGKLDDEIWKSAKIEKVTGFLQMEPDEGETATESTLVATVYDDEAIYFAFWCFDSEPEKIKQQMVRRDRWSEADYVRVRLDPYHDHQTGYEFRLNASGVQRDFRMFDDVNMDQSWDGIWEGEVAIHPWGWAAEFKIPYHNLRFTKKNEHVWGVNVTRYISRKAEVDWWEFSPSTEGGSVSQFGHLEGITGIEPVRQLQVLPYAVSKFQTEPSHLGNPNGRDMLGDVGFDVKYGISSNLTLDATINPDFGQVELDRPVLDLSPFETFFSEKRPFFIEGSDLFSTRFMLLNSRRIGRAITGGVDDDDLDVYTDYPETATILGAAKITGKLSGGTSLGFLNAVTKEESADYLTVDGEERTGVVEPSANYSVLRVKQDLLSNSYVGVLVTTTSQKTRTPATTGGLDWQLYTNNGTWGFGGQTVFSRNSGEPVGFGMAVELQKAAGKHWRGSIGGTVKDQNLYINRMGYTSRNDIRSFYGWLQYRTQDDWFVFRNTYHNMNIYAGWNYARDNIDKGWNYNFYLDFINNWSLGGGLSQSIDDYSDWETRGMGLWERPKSWSWWASLHTDGRKKVSFSLNPGSGQSRFGSWWAHYTGVEFRPTANMEYGLGVNILKDNDQRRWVGNPVDSITNEEVTLFADLDQTRVTLNVSASFMLHKNLSCQLSANGLLAGLDYEDYRLYEGGNQYSAVGDYGGIDAPNSDYNYSSLNSTLLMRWEYLPGSTLYFVWTRSRPEVDDTVNDLNLSRDFDRFFSEGASNIFLVKASYWLNI